MPVSLTNNQAVFCRGPPRYFARCRTMWKNICGNPVQQAASNGALDTDEQSACRITVQATPASNSFRVRPLTWQVYNHEDDARSPVVKCKVQRVGQHNAEQFPPLDLWAHTGRAKACVTHRAAARSPPHERCDIGSTCMGQATSNSNWQSPN